MTKREQVDILIDLKKVHQRVGYHLNRMEYRAISPGFLIRERLIRELKDEVRRLDALAVEMERTIL